HQHFGIRVRLEHVTTFLQCTTQRRGILDDAVVNEREGAVFVHMRVRVALGWRTVCGPARMRNADRSVNRLPGNHGLEAGDLSGRPAKLDPVSVLKRYARGIISAVFETLEPLHEERSGSPA